MIVFAAKISSVTEIGINGSLLRFYDKQIEPKFVARTWVVEHQPIREAFYIKYHDGFTGCLTAVNLPLFLVEAVTLKFNQQSVPEPASDPSRNWIEDANHENGQYQNRCVFCSQIFIGHKRRVACKACAPYRDITNAVGPQKETP